MGDVRVAVKGANYEATVTIRISIFIVRSLWIMLYLLISVIAAHWIKIAILSK